MGVLSKCVTVVTVAAVSASNSTPAESTTAAPASAATTAAPAGTTAAPAAAAATTTAAPVVVPEWLVDSQCKWLTANTSTVKVNFGAVAAATPQCCDAMITVWTIGAIGQYAAMAPLGVPPYSTAYCQANGMGGCVTAPTNYTGVITTGANYWDPLNPTNMVTPAHLNNMLPTYTAFANAIGAACANGRFCVRESAQFVAEDVAAGDGRKLYFEQADNGLCASVAATPLPCHLAPAMAAFGTSLDLGYLNGACCDAAAALLNEHFAIDQNKTTAELSALGITECLAWPVSDPAVATGTAPFLGQFLATTGNSACDANRKPKADAVARTKASTCATNGACAASLRTALTGKTGTLAAGLLAKLGTANSTSDLCYVAPPPPTTTAAPAPAKAASTAAPAQATSAPVNTNVTTVTATTTALVEVKNTMAITGVKVTLPASISGNATKELKAQVAIQKGVHTAACAPLVAAGTFANVAECFSTAGSAAGVKTTMTATWDATFFTAATGAVSYRRLTATTNDFSFDVVAPKAVAEAAGTGVAAVLTASPPTTTSLATEVLTSWNAAAAADADIDTINATAIDTSAAVVAAPVAVTITAAPVAPVAPATTTSNAVAASMSALLLVASALLA